MTASNAAGPLRVASLGVLQLLLLALAVAPVARAFPFAHMAMQPGRPQQLPPFLLHQNNPPPLSLLHLGAALTAASGPHSPVEPQPQASNLQQNFYGAASGPVSQQNRAPQNQQQFQHNHHSHSVSNSVHFQSPRAAQAYLQHQRQLAANAAHFNNYNNQRAPRQQLGARPSQQTAYASASNQNQNQNLNQNQPQQYAQVAKSGQQQQHQQQASGQAYQQQQQQQHQHQHQQPQRPLSQQQALDKEFLSAVQIIDTDGQQRNLNEFGLGGLDDHTNQHELVGQLKSIFSAITDDLQNAQFLPIDVHSGHRQLGNAFQDSPYAANQLAAGNANHDQPPPSKQQQPPPPPPLPSQNFQFITPKRVNGLANEQPRVPTTEGNLRSPVQAAREQLGVGSYQTKQENANVQQEHVEVEPAAPRPQIPSAPVDQRPIAQVEQQQQQQQQQDLDQFDDEKLTPMQQPVQQPVQQLVSAERPPVSPVYHSQARREETNRQQQQPQQVPEQQRQVSEEAPPVEQQRLNAVAPFQQAQLEQQQVRVEQGPVEQQQQKQSLGFDEEPVAPLKSFEHEPTHVHRLNVQQQQQAAKQTVQEPFAEEKRQPASQLEGKARVQQPVNQYGEGQRQAPEQVPQQPEGPFSRPEFDDVDGQRKQQPPPTGKTVAGWVPIVPESSPENVPQRQQQSQSQPQQQQQYGFFHPQFHQLIPSHKQAPLAPPPPQPQLFQGGLKGASVPQAFEQQRNRNEDGFGDEHPKPLSGLVSQAHPVQQQQQQPQRAASPAKEVQTGDTKGSSNRLSKFREAINKFTNSSKSKLAPVTAAQQQQQQQADDFGATKMTVQRPERGQERVQHVQQQQQDDELSPQIQRQVQEEQRQEQIDEQQQPIPLNESQPEQPQQQRELAPVKGANQAPVAQQPELVPATKTSANPAGQKSVEAAPKEEQRPKSLRKIKPVDRVRKLSQVPVRVEQQQTLPAAGFEVKNSPNSGKTQSGGETGRKSGPRSLASKFGTNVPSTPRQVGSKKARVQTQKQSPRQQQLSPLPVQQQKAEITIQLAEMQEQMSDIAGGQQQQAIEEQQHKEPDPQVGQVAQEEQRAQPVEQQREDVPLLTSERPTDQVDQQQPQVEQAAVRDETQAKVSVDEQQQQQLFASSDDQSSEQPKQQQQQFSTPSTAPSSGAAQNEAQIEQKQEQQQPQTEQVQQQQQQQQLQESPVEQPVQKEVQVQQQQDRTETVESQTEGSNYTQQKIDQNQQQQAQQQAELDQDNQSTPARQMQQQTDEPTQQDKTSSEAPRAQTDQQPEQEPQSQQQQQVDEEQPTVPTTTTTTTTPVSTPRPQVKAGRQSAARKTVQQARPLGVKSQQQRQQAAQNKASTASQRPNRVGGAMQGSRQQQRVFPTSSKSVGDYSQPQPTDNNESRNSNQNLGYPNAQQLLDTFNPLQFEPERLNSVQNIKAAQQITNAEDSTNANSSSPAESY